MRVNKAATIFFSLWIFIFLWIEASSEELIAKSRIISDFISKIEEKEQIIFLEDIQAESRLELLAKQISRQLAVELLYSGFVVTVHRKNWEEPKISGSLSYLDKNLRLKLNFASSDTAFSQIYEVNESNQFLAKNIKIFGDLVQLFGGEIENLSFSNSIENRTSTVNQRDFTIGIGTEFGENFQSQLSLRSRTSFGEDNIKLESVYFCAKYESISLLTGIYRLQLGENSRYLNSTLKNPYWRQGLIFDSQISGLHLGFSQPPFFVDFDVGANRNPSAVSALTLGIQPIDALTLSASGLYVNRDDRFNDIGQHLGLEALWKYSQFFCNLIFSYKYFEGERTNPERKIKIFLVDYEKKLGDRWIYKGAYLLNFHKVNWEEKREKRLFQGLEYWVNSFFTPEIQYENFRIDSFSQNNITGILNFTPINSVQIATQIGYIVPEFGKKLLFLGLESRIQF